MISVFEALPTMTATSTTNPRADMAACLVRVAGHDFMDFRYNSDNTTTGGMDGCINFADPENAGLATCMNIPAVISIYRQFCGRLSLADFFVIMSEAMLIRTEATYSATSLWSDRSYSDALVKRFNKGRKTNYVCSTVGLLPDAEHGCTDL